jgi:hypothetical protein
VWGLGILIKNPEKSSQNLHFKGRQRVEETLWKSLFWGEFSGEDLGFLGGFDPDGVSEGFGKFPEKTP